MYSKKELIHSISFLSNAAYDIQASSFDVLQKNTTDIVNATLTNLDVQNDIGVWTPIWGPVVFSNNPSSKTVVADNTMMLVYNQAENLFVVGIAGTNVVSTYGFFQEDFKVNNMVKWSDVVKKDIKNSGSIAEGTYLGLNILNDLKGPELTVNHGTGPAVTMITALQNFIALTDNHIANAEVAVTGHSLGGALAPVMAMYLQETATGGWNNGNVTTISAWPTAGPTPGNADFAKYVAAQMGTNYQSYYNPLDVIPQAWQTSTLELIPNLYKDYLTAPESVAPYNTPVGTLAVGALLNTVNPLINPFGPIQYTQVLPWNVLPDAKFNSDMNNALNIYFNTMKTIYISNSSLKAYLPYLQFLLLFLKQMLYQHTKAYNSMLGIEDFMNKYDGIKYDILHTTQGALDDEAFRYALKKYYNIPDLKQIAENAKLEEAQA